QGLARRGRSSRGGHARPPLGRRAAAAPAGTIAVRRGARADVTAGADWPVATAPTGCALAPSRAGGSAGLLLGFGGDDGHGTPASCGAHAPSCWVVCSRLTTSSRVSNPMNPILGERNLDVKSGL